MNLVFYSFFFLVKCRLGQHCSWNHSALYWQQKDHLLRSNRMIEYQSWAPSGVQRIKPISLCLNFCFRRVWMLRLHRGQGLRALPRGLLWKRLDWHAWGLSTLPLPGPKQLCPNRIDRTGGLHQLPPRTDRWSHHGSFILLHLYICIQLAESTHHVCKVNLKLLRLAAEDGSQESPRWCGLSAWKQRRDCYINGGPPRSPQDSWEISRPEVKI